MRCVIHCGVGYVKYLTYPYTNDRPSISLFDAAPVCYQMQVDGSRYSYNIVQHAVNVLYAWHGMVKDPDSPKNVVLYIYLLSVL